MTQEHDQGRDSPQRSGADRPALRNGHRAPGRCDETSQRNGRVPELALRSHAGMTSITARMASTHLGRMQSGQRSDCELRMAI